MIKSLINSSISNPQDYRSMSAGVVPSNEYLISTTVLTQNEPSVTFDVSSFAGVYKHLQIVSVARSSRNTGLADAIAIRLNGDMGSNYIFHRMINDVNSVISQTFSSQTRVIVSSISQATSSSGIFGAVVTDILDPYSTTKNTTLRSLGGVTNPNEIGFISGLYNSTLPISSITLLSWEGQNFVAGSRFSLYGVTA